MEVKRPDSFSSLNSLTPSLNISETKIKSLDEYEKNFNETWPSLPDDIVLPSTSIEDVFGSIDDVKKMLVSESFDKNALFNEMENRIENIEKFCDIYKNEIFSNDSKRVSRKKANRFFAPDKSDDSFEDSIFLTEAEIINKPLEDDKDKLLLSAHRRKKKFMDQNQKKRLENVVYIGFSYNDLSDLPGFLEPPQILQAVTSSMGFTPSFMKFWSPIIRSEASSAILLDSFWWFYLHYFKNDSTLDNDKLLYFSRIADSFVALFLTIDITMRDKFFNIYPNFLSQAIYLTFYRSCSDSKLQFNDDFKQEICDTVNEWILGVKPIPEIYKEWKIPIDSLSTRTNSDGKIVSTSELIQKIGNLDKMLKNLGTEEETASKSNLSPSNKSPLFKSSFSKKLVEKVQYRDNADEILTRFYEKKNIKSHAIGEGAVVEKVLFNLRGQSILISHYLTMHNLQETEPQGHKVTRSQISQNPLPSAPTYKDVIFETLERTKTLETEFEKISKQTEDEIKKIEIERRKGILESEKSNNNIVKRNKEMSNVSSRGGKKSGKQKTKDSNVNNSGKDFEDTYEDFDDIPFGAGDE